MKLSIITVNLNNKSGLQKTIDSVISQTYKDFEWIIIDGGSTDGSKELIEKYSSYITYWVSEPDKGIYNAMNKGIKVAKGEYCLFLNSGDLLFNCSIIATVSQMRLFADFIVFDIKLIYDNAFVDRNLIHLKEKHILQFLYQDAFPHQSTLIKKSVLIKYGLYDETYKYVSDWYLTVKACVFGNASFEYMQGITLSYYDTTGISSIYVDEVIEERIQIIKKEFPDPIVDCIKSAIEWDIIDNSIKKSRLIKYLFHILLRISVKI